MELKYYFSEKFLNLDHKTCVSLNLFGNKNSVFSLFSPVTNMGKRLLKRRINQPSADPHKIDKWYENLKALMSKSDSGIHEINLKQLIKTFSNLDTN